MTWTTFGWIIFAGIALFLAMTIVNAGHHP